ncbi:MAG: hypothetical protein ACYTE6_06950 [Planctomycetota bacterium]|jgi:hypothetical protein
MPSDDGRASHTFRIADALTLRVAGPPALLGPFDRFYGPMRTERPGPADLDVRLSPMRATDRRFVFEQTYRGGRWRIGLDDLCAPCLEADVAVDRLGRVMVAQAGVGSLLRYLLGRRGLVWVHAGVLVRGDEALLLAGPSGVGKTQLVLRAIGCGWQYITDDQALIGDTGLSGLTTPILVRGYGGWPQDMRQPMPLRLRRLAARAVRSISRGRVNLMLGFTPPAAQLEASPAPRRYQTTVCLLEPGGTVTARSTPPEELVDSIVAQMRHAGRFLDELMDGATVPAAVDLEAFWSQQCAIVGRFLPGCLAFRATVPRVIDAGACQSLLGRVGPGDRHG